MSSPLDSIPLLQRLLAAKSYSGEERLAADVLEAALRDTHGGFDVQRIGDNLVCTKGSGELGLLFNSHLDTVPASPRWTRDPWSADIEEDKLFGLGATDAKSCVAAMAAAFVAAPDPGSAGRLIFTATTEEETGGMGKPNGMETTLPMLGKLAAGVIGEPTALNVCNGQRGMVRLVLHAEGRAGHASRPWEGENAIEKAAEDIVALRALAATLGETRRDPLLGPPTIQPTMMSAGTAKNVIPDYAEITLDARTTQTCDNRAMIEAIKQAVQIRVEVISERFKPVGTPDTEPIIRAARHALPAAELRAFGGVSDLYFLTQTPDGPTPCCLIGPGDGRQSHQPDEFVSISNVRKAVDAYTTIAASFWEHLG